MNYYRLFLHTQVPLLDTIETVGLTAYEMGAYLAQGRVNIAVFDSRYGPNSFSPNYYSGINPNNFEYTTVTLQRNNDDSASLCCADRSVIAEFLRQRRQYWGANGTPLHRQEGRPFPERLAEANRFYDQHYAANIGKQSDYENQAQNKAQNQARSQREAMRQNEEVKALTAAQQLSLF